MVKNKRESTPHSEDWSGPAAVTGDEHHEAPLESCSFPGRCDVENDPEARRPACNCFTMSSMVKMVKGGKFKSHNAGVSMMPLFDLLLWLENKNVFDY